MTTNTPAQAPKDFIATELRGIIEVCGDSPTAIVSVERMRLWLSKLRAPVAGPIQWPTMPPSKGQSPVLFEDGYAEGWAKCMDECRRAVSAASAPVAGEAQKPIGFVDPVYVAGRQRGMPWNAKIYDAPNQEATAPLYAAPQASEAVRDTDRQQASAPLLKAARRAVLALAAAAERDPAFQGDYDALSAALSAQPGEPKGGSDAE